jgi:c-di-GMP-binding flagellar brake protein YcgR
MTSYENIEGPKLNTIFEDLASTRTLVKVSLAHGDYESLSVVAYTPMEDTHNLFTIDPPKGLVQAIAQSNSSRLHFEFTSDDGVAHHFDSEIKTISNSHVCLHFPPFIQRHQQRDNFRVKVIFDSFAKLIIEESEVRMEIENLSLGGVYCLCLNKHKAKFAEQQILQGLELNITAPNECHVVAVEQAKVNRIESKPRPKHFGIAFEFIRLKREAKKILTQQIYELQRQRLQHRLKFFE